MFSSSVKIIVLFFILVSILRIDAMAQNNEEFDIDAVSIELAAQKVQWHGYYEFECRDTENNNNTFDAHKITIWMGLPINKMVFLSSEIEYEHFPRLQDSTQKTGGSGQIKLDSKPVLLEARSVAS